MKKKIINIGLLGCGRVAYHYVDMFKILKVKNFKIVAVCDKNIIKAKKLSKIFNCNFYTKFKSLVITEKIDLLIILTPSGDHYKNCVMAIKKKINILCEKPLTMLPSQAKYLIKLSKSKKVMCGVVFQNRFNPSIQYLKESLKKNLFGKIIKVSISLLWCRYQSYYNDGWHGTWKNDGGVINQQAIHHIDILRWLFGPIKEISSYTTKRMNKLEAEDTAVACFRLKNGGLGTIEATTAARPKDIEASLSLVGSKGSIEIGGIALNKILKIELIKKVKIKHIIKKFSERVKNGYGKSHRIILEKTIINLQKNNKTPIIEPIESLKTTELIHSLYKSEEIGKSIRLNRNNYSKRLGV